MVNRCYTLLPEVDESYSRLPPTLRQDFLDSLNFSAKLWFNSILSGEFPSSAELEVIANTGRRRVHQGIALASLLRAFRLGAREIWSEFLLFAREDPQVRDELLFDVSRYLLEYFDVLSQTMAQAYLDEQHQRMRWRDSLRYELAMIIFQFPEDVGNFRRSAEALGLDPTVPRIALALDLDLRLAASPPGKLEGDFDRFTLAASRHLKAAYEDLVRVPHRGRLVIWAPCVRGDNVVGADRRAVEGAAALLKSIPEITAIGVGLMNHGPAGWAMSVDEAFKALEFGLRRKPARKLHLYSDIAVNESVRRSDNVLRYLSSLMERLSSEPDLIATLQIYFDQQQRRKLTADVLGIHPNTLNHRLERIEHILGASLDDASWIAKLHIALKLRERSIPDASTDS
ncbi:MAG: helix-turn-helix domain-containing protein [Gammaproteobacteria bacterium]